MSRELTSRLPDCTVRTLLPCSSAAALYTQPLYLIPATEQIWITVCDEDAIYSNKSSRALTTAQRVSNAALQTTQDMVSPSYPRLVTQDMVSPRLVAGNSSSKSTKNPVYMPCAPLLHHRHHLLAPRREVGVGANARCCGNQISQHTGGWSVIE
jgi:hypothetical protein